MKRVLICGDRNWTDKEAIKRVLSAYPKDTVVIHGGNGTVDKKTKKIVKGADMLADEAARELGLEVIVFKPNWARFGRGAGPMRNRDMLTEGCPTECIAFHHDIAKSKGTKNMVTQAREANVPTKVWAG